MFVSVSGALDNRWGKDWSVARPPHTFAHVVVRRHWSSREFLVHNCAGLSTTDSFASLFSSPCLVFNLSILSILKTYKPAQWEGERSKYSLSRYGRVTKFSFYGSRQLYTTSIRWLQCSRLNLARTQSLSYLSKGTPIYSSHFCYFWPSISWRPSILNYIFIPSSPDPIPAQKWVIQESIWTRSSLLGWHCCHYLR